MYSSEDRLPRTTVTPNIIHNGLLTYTLFSPTNIQAPVVRRVDNAIHRINPYPVDNR